MDAVERDTELKEEMVNSRSEEENLRRGYVDNIDTQYRGKSKWVNKEKLRILNKRKDDKESNGGKN